MNPTWGSIEICTRKMSSKANDPSRDIEAQNEYEIEQHESERSQLDRIRSAGVFTISPELFEKVHDQTAGSNSV